VRVCERARASEHVCVNVCVCVCVCVNSRQHHVLKLLWVEVVLVVLDARLVQRSLDGHKGLSAGLRLQRVLFRRVYACNGSTEWQSRVYVQMCICMHGIMRHTHIHTHVPAG
jgi:hypothetical protein